MRLRRAGVISFIALTRCASPSQSTTPPAAPTPSDVSKLNSSSQDAAVPHPSAVSTASADPCREGEDLDACVRNALERRKGGLDRDGAWNTKLLVVLEKACAKDQAVACEGVAEMLQDAPYYAVQEDPRAAVIAWDKACRLGNKHACYRLGFCYVEWLTNGFAVDESGRLRAYSRDEDHRRGVALLKDACAAGIAESCEAAKHPLPR